jgi:tetratricopeptide (TPR) repeat protein
LRQLQQSHPGDYWANQTLAGVLQYRQHPQWEEAIRYYTAAEALRPMNPGVCADLGNALWGKGDRDGALAAYRRAIAIAPSYSAAHRSVGSKLRAMGDRDGADAAYRRSVDVAPDRSRALWHLGITLSADDHDVDGAIAAYRKAIELDPNFAMAHYNLGCALHDQNKLAEEIAAYRKAIELDPNFAKAYHNLGCALREQGKFEEAVAASRKAIELDPKRGPAYINLWNALARQGKHEESLAVYRKAIELDPRDFGPQLAGWLFRAMARLRAGQTAEALAEVDEVTKTVKPSAGVFYNAACVYAVASTKIADKEQEYANRAMELLRQAVKHGHSSAAYTKQDADLEPLRGREDFKKLLAELEARAKQPATKEPQPK